VASPASGVKTPPLSREAAIPETTSEDPKDGDHDETAALLDEVDIHIVQEDGMLRLPSELLEMVASNLLGTKHILNLGLANKRLSRIVQETVVRNLIVSGRNINGFLAMLSHHPELLSKVSSVHLGEFGCSHGFGCPCASSDSLNRHVLRALGAAISETTGHTADWSQIRDSNAPGSVVWRRETAFSLDVLATSCPSIKSVTVQLPEARSFSSGQPPRPRQRAPLAFPALNPELLPTAPFQGPALHLFQAKLEALTIAVDIKWKGPPTLEVLESHDLKWRNMGSHIITLANFSRLKRLDIPMDILGRPNDIIFSPTGSLVAATQHVDASPDGALPVGKTLAELRSKVIPLSIQNLRLRSCNKWTFALLQRINEIPLGELRLKHIGLSFDTPSKHLIIQCNAVEQGPLDYLRLLADLDRKRIEVTFYNGPQDAPVDMWKELKAFSLLQPFEVWRCSGSLIPFSKWNPEVSEQRRLLTAGSRLFLRHADHHPQLLNSPTFDLRSWAQGAFFRGIENSKWDPQLQDPNKKVQTIDPSDWYQRTLGKCAFRRRLSPLLSKFYSNLNEM
jgi:hypothetical protein